MVDLAALALVYWGRTKQMTKWIEYTGSDEQIEELKIAFIGDGFIVKKANGRISGRIQGGIPLAEGFIEYNFQESWCVEEYLICQPHPYADIIKIWADTGCEVYWKNKTGGGSGVCHEYFPPFAHPNDFEYRLTPFED